MSATRSSHFPGATIKQTGAIINHVSTPASIRREVFVSGRVQGVFFRQSCKRVALDNHVSGSAENLPDGRVHVILEGTPQNVARVLEWCQTGPPAARVENVEIIEVAPRGMSGFMTR